MTFIGRIVCWTSLCVAPVAAQDVQELGSFLLVQQTDPITDEAKNLVFTQSHDFEPARLAWSCILGAPHFVMSVPDYLGADRDVRVVWRIDKTTPFEDRWPTSSTGRDLLPITQSDALTEQALPGDTLVIRFWDLDDRTHTYTFSLAGLTRALNWLGCKGQTLSSTRTVAIGDRMQIQDPCENKPCEVTLWQSPQLISPVGVARDGYFAVVRDVSALNSEIAYVEIVHNNPPRRISGWVQTHYLGGLFGSEKCEIFFMNYPALIRKCIAG